MNRQIEQIYISHHNELTNSLSALTKEIKSEALKTLRQHGLPGHKDEFWRKTDWKNHIESRLQLKRPGVFEPPSNASDYDFFLTDGILYGKQNLVQYDNGIIAGSLAQATLQFPGLVEKYFHRIVKPKFNNLSALNTLLFRDGFFLYVPEGVACDRNIRIINMVTEAQKQSQFHQRNLIVLEPDASVNVEVYDTGSSQADAFITDLTEIRSGQNAVLNYYRRQDLPEKVSLVNMNYSENESRSLLHAHIMTFNGEYIRNEVFSFLKGEEADVNWRGIYLPDTDQKVDNRIFIIHDAVRTLSNQQFKGILQDRSRSFFNGYILVERGAQQTNAYQQNANLLLSRRAKASSYPFLEIYADDVSCSHGSTTGQLDDEALFYIRQRGIDEQTARKMILRSFAGEVIDTLPQEAWRADADKYLDKKLSASNVLETV